MALAFSTDRSIDLLAGAASKARPDRAASRPTILVLDSGLGGLTVLREIASARPEADYVYAADDAAFPYGAWAEGPLVARVETVVERLLSRYRPDLVAVACNTISTLVLPRLRARFDTPFVGIVPAIKPAAALSRTGRIAVLATPGTVRRDYTRELIAAYAGDCRVDLVGSTRLASLAEGDLRGEPASDAAILAEIAPCFSARDGRRTDVVVLACTHYPLLLDRLGALAPWPVAWIDPAPAVARRVAQILGDPAANRSSGPAGETVAVFTGAGPGATALAGALGRFGLGEVVTGALPLH